MSLNITFWGKKVFFLKKEGRLVKAVRDTINNSVRRYVVIQRKTQDKQSKSFIPLLDGWLILL